MPVARCLELILITTIKGREQPHGPSSASAYVTEESGQVSRYSRRLLSRCEVPTTRKNCPPLNVVDPLQIRAWWLTLGNGLVREDTECCGRSDVSSIYRVPTIVPIVTHRRRDCLRDPVQRKRGAQEVIGWRDITPRMPLLAHICGQSHGRVIQSIADGLGFC